jgi:hypothetical protein
MIINEAAELPACLQEADRAGKKFGQELRRRKPITARTTRAWQLRLQGSASLTSKFTRSSTTFVVERLSVENLAAMQAL